MIFFIPYANLALSAHVYHERELFNYQHGTRMLLQAFSGHRSHKPFRNGYSHWERYPAALLYFYNALVLEWERRGIEPLFEMILDKRSAQEASIHPEFLQRNWRPPGWIGWEEMHHSHRNSLCTRDRYYRKLWNSTGAWSIRVLFPYNVPKPGEFLLRRTLPGLVMEHHERKIELLFKKKFIFVDYADVERGKWLPDVLPVHERLKLEFGSGRDQQQSGE